MDSCLKNKTAVILVGYNSRRFLGDCINSLLASEGCELPIIVYVDNASSDDSVLYLRQNHPSVIVIENDMNYGFGKGCNIGAEYALKNGAEYILFLNVDTISEPKMLFELQKSANSNTVTTAFSYNDMQKKTPWYAGGHFDKKLVEVYQLDYADCSDESPKEVDFISGACMLIHRSVIEKVGLFDESMFMYWEDVDLCIRLKQHNVRMLYLPRARMFHYEGGCQLKEKCRIANYYGSRNRLLVAERYASCFGINALDFVRKQLFNSSYFEGNQYAQKKVNYHLQGITDYLRMKLGNGEQVLFVYDDGFFPADSTEEKNIYAWKSKKKSVMKVCNFGDKPKCGTVSFELTALSDTQFFMDVYDDDGVLYKQLKLPQSISLPVFLNAQEVKSFKFEYFGQGEKCDSDDRIMYGCVRNANFETSTGLYFDNGYRESDGGDEWYWQSAVEKEWNVYNFFPVKKDCILFLHLNCAPTVETSVMDVYVDGSLLEKDLKLPCRLLKRFELKPLSYVSLKFVHKGEVIHGVGADKRDFSFCLKNPILRPLLPFDKNKKTALYGTGLVAEKFLSDNPSLRVCGVFDRIKINGEKYGLPILDFSKIADYKVNQIIIAAKPEHVCEIYNRIIEACIRNSVGIYGIDFRIL